MGKRKEEWKEKANKKFGIMKAIDKYAVYYIAPSYLGMIATLIGTILLIVYLVILIQSWAKQPYFTIATIEPTSDKLFNMTIKCNALLCRIQNSYANAKNPTFCSRSLNSSAPINLNLGQSTNVTLCYSPNWQDGIKVTVPLGNIAEILSPPVVFITNKMEAPLPPVNGLSLDRLIVSMEYILSEAGTVNEEKEKENTRGERIEYWNVANVQDIQLSCSADVGLDLFATCYLIKISPVSTILKQVPSFDWFRLLSEFGGAKNGIFSIIGIIMFIRIVVKNIKKSLKKEKDQNKQKPKDIPMSNVV